MLRELVAVTPPDLSARLAALSHQPAAPVQVQSFGCGIGGKQQPAVQVEPSLHLRSLGRAGWSGWL